MSQRRFTPKAPEKLFIGGQWVDAISKARLEVISPVTEEPILSYPEAGVADIDRAVAEARDAFDNGPWPRMAPSERARYLRKVGELLSQRLDEIANAWTLQVGAPIMLTKKLVGQNPTLFNYYADLIEKYPFVDDRKRDDGGKVKVVKEPVGVCAAITPWNAPLVLLELQGRGRPRRGLHHRLEAFARDAAGSLHPRRMHREGRTAAGRVQPRAGRPRRRRLSRAPQGRRQGRIHRLDRGRQAHRGGVRAAPCARQPRAWRQVAGDPARRCGLRRGVAEPDDLFDADHRTGVLFADARAGAGAAQGRVPRHVPGRGVEDQGRRSVRPGHADGPAHHGAAALARAGLHRGGARRGRQNRVRRRPAEGAQSGLLHRADRIHRCASVHEDRAGGDFRSRSFPC